MKPIAARGIASVAVLALAAPGVAASGRQLSPPKPEAAIAVASDTLSKDGVVDAYANLPLSFIPNAGQADPRVLYSARRSGFGVSFTPGEALLSFVKEDRGHTLALRFEEASPEASLTASQQLPGTVNYLIGNPAEWRTGLPTYEQILYRDLWPGVDAVFRGGEGRLKYEFHLAPRARASDLRLGYEGADRLALGEEGELLIHTPLGILSEARPISYQWIGGSRTVVDSRYVLWPDGTYGFALEPGYDPRLPLVIDPELVYSTFLGGARSDGGLPGIAIDSAGHAYVTGGTESFDFPTTPGAFDTTYNGVNDAFVTKLSRDGSALVYSTFVGGESAEWGTGIAVDPAGRAYVTGFTVSLDFPTTPGAFDTTLSGNGDAFVTKLSRDGSALVYSTFLGGTESGEADPDVGQGIAVDVGLATTSHAYVTGWTQSLDFPTTPGAFDTTLDGFVDAFVTKLSADGSGLVYSTFLGGESSELGRGVAVGQPGHAYVTGETDSSDFPTTPGAFDTTYNGNGDAYVTKLSPDGSSLSYSTFLGGEYLDVGHSIAVGQLGHAYVTGATSSSDFPTTPGAFDRTHNGDNDAFITKLSPDGAALVYSTFLGGRGYDFGNGIAIDSAGHAYVTGGTESFDFPTTPDGFDTTHNGVVDAFVTKLNRDGSALVYSTFLGGAHIDEGYGIGVHTGVHSAAHVYVTGQTYSPDFPTTPDAFDTTFNGSIDSFVSKFVIGDKATR